MACAEPEPTTLHSLPEHLVGALYALLPDTGTKKAFLASSHAVRCAPVLEQISSLRISKQDLRACSLLNTISHHSSNNPLLQFPRGALLKQLTIGDPEKPDLLADAVARVLEVLMPPQEHLRVQVQQRLVHLEALYLHVVIRDRAVASTLGALIRSLPRLRVLWVASGRRLEAEDFFTALTAQTTQPAQPVLTTLAAQAAQPAVNTQRTQTAQAALPALNIHTAQNSQVTQTAQSVQPANSHGSLRHLGCGLINPSVLEVINRLTLESLAFELSLRNALFTPSALQPLSLLTTLQHLTITSACVVRGLEDVLPHLQHLKSLSLYDFDSCAQLAALPPSIEKIQLHKVSSSCLCAYVGTIVRHSFHALHNLHVDRLILCLGSEHRSARELAAATASRLAAVPSLDVSVAQLYGLSGMAHSTAEYLEPLPQIASRLGDVYEIPSAMMTWEV